MTADNAEMSSLFNIVGGHSWRLRAAALALRGPPLQFGSTIRYRRVKSAANSRGPKDNLIRLRYHGRSMSRPPMKPGAGRPPGPSLFGLLKPYRPLTVTLVAMTIFGNGLNLIIPRLIAQAIDVYRQQRA